MPELPEVHTTVTGLSQTIVGKIITDVWSDYNSPYFKNSKTIKDRAYFATFKKTITGSKIIKVSRRAKNILIHIKPQNSSSHRSESKIILIHMKMTGHLMVGNYVMDTTHKHWIPAPHERESLRDPFNKYIHFVITLSDGNHLVLSDARKFAKITLLDTADDLQKLDAEHGPEPLEPHFSFSIFKKQLYQRPHGKIKTVLMDQTILSGIGNIYSDEALWRAGINPEERVQDIPDQLLKKLYAASIKVLRYGIDFGGDSMSDYRNVHGERGTFQEQHRAYRKTGEQCSFIMNGVPCSGTIVRKVVNGRSAHFCTVHQKLMRG